MEINNKDPQQKIRELFDARAKALPDCNSVLDANNTEDVKFQNIFRDYHTKNLAKSYINPSKQDTILDFGCGVGRLSEHLAPRAKKIVGLDLSLEMLNVARKNTKNQNVEYRKIDELDLIDEKTFDKIFAFWVLGHIEDETLSKYVEKFHKVLKNDGSVFIFEQTRPKTINIKDILIQRAEEDYIKLFTDGGFKLTKKKNVFRFPSYGMDVWKKIGINSSLFLSFSGLVENLTVNRKLESAEYCTQLFIFKKS
jgi:2-polyprenyl-3-methyl-5-hydroxy-6-metoxy-1,4-benzoquinol methylase